MSHDHVPLLQCTTVVTPRSLNLWVEATTMRTRAVHSDTLSNRWDPFSSKILLSNNCPSFRASEKKASVKKSSLLLSIRFKVCLHICHECDPHKIWCTVPTSLHVSRHAKLLWTNPYFPDEQGAAGIPLQSTTPLLVLPSTTKCHEVLRLSRKVTPQPHQILRLPHKNDPPTSPNTAPAHTKINVISGLRHIWKLISNAWSK